MRSQHAEHSLSLICEHIKKGASYPNANKKKYKKLIESYNVLADYFDKNSTINVRHNFESYLRGSGWPEDAIGFTGTLHMALCIKYCYERQIFAAFISQEYYLLLGMEAANLSQDQNAAYVPTVITDSMSDVVRDFVIKDNEKMDALCKNIRANASKKIYGTMAIAKSIVGLEKAA